MKYVFALLFLSFALSAQAADRVIATLTVTNAAGTTNGQTLTVNGSVRTLTNSVFVPSTQILTNSTAAGSKTNILSQISLNPFAQVIAQDYSATALRLSGVSGVTLTVTPSAGWAEVTYVTQTVASVVGVRVPITSEPSGGQQTNIASLLVSGIGSLSTNSFYESNIAVTNLVGITNAQTISGLKQFTNVGGIWYGYVSNSTGISGNVNYMTNGLYRSPVLNDATLTNGSLYGSIQLFGTLDLGGTITFDGTASSISADGDYFTMQPESGSRVLLGTSGPIQGVMAYDGYFTNNVTSLSITTTNINTYGGSVLRSTNTFPAGSDIAFGRYALTTLANGANSISVGTNAFIEVSGPSAAFTINGITGSPNRDGKTVIILNQTTFNMTVAHDSGTEPTAANRIYTMTGADRATIGNGAAMLIYSSAASRWILFSLDQ
jgi:hypothetical protein